MALQKDYAGELGGNCASVHEHGVHRASQGTPDGGAATESDDEIRPARAEAEGSTEARAHRGDLDSLVEHRHPYAERRCPESEALIGAACFHPVIHIVMLRDEDCERR